MGREDLNRKSCGKSTPHCHPSLLQEGADADIVAFDPAIVRDQATYQSPDKPSVGMKYVIVNGTIIVDTGTLVPNVFPGKAVLPTHRQ
jgi:N-acyl-D-aspartate/D-glutamate deacylase